jgi:hypothetical protein
MTRRRVGSEQWRRGGALSRDGSRRLYNAITGRGREEFQTHRGTHLLDARTWECVGGLVWSCQGGSEVGWLVQVMDLSVHHLW